ncbi:hypothetical protein L226DRAFT_572939 [Lentinus tigrinus ALCF2SS1-7]|uniref:Uncharacterized protein n=1 Tax=Lentinus tigrinus ALCF2SS1-6 TaxID=1328759 RepID=A0A5C2S661_9APHY|nr:hypothetical protein L227DRAFT_612637 [Lentinus tigrinus ALCF2SS1-6]RPD72845.1 hypothetical protein L226DRAFT_572939 [Lentinus tigrinus ALCF2SS1-7]
MSGIPALALSSSAISGIPRHASSRSDPVLAENPACHILETRCCLPHKHLAIAQFHILYEKAAQRRLRAEIAAFLRERGTIRSANCPVKAEDDVTLPGAGEPMDTSQSADIYDIAGQRYLDESPLVQRSKRKLALFSDESESPEGSPLKRRRFAWVP